MAQTTNIEDTIERDAPGYNLAGDITTLDSLIDGEDPATDDFAAMLAPIRDNLRNALRALLAVNLVIAEGDWDASLDGDDARDLVAEALVEGVE
jgi:hypothetical protein